MKTAGRLGVAAAVLWVAAGVAAAVAAPPAPERARAGGRGERGPAALAEFLGLTEQQKASWKALHERHREEMKPLAEEGLALRRKLREAVEAPAPDPTAVGEATLALDAHRKALKARRDAFQAEVEGLLDPQQKEKLEAWKAARRTMRPGRDARPRGPRRPGAPAAPPVEG